MSTNNYTKEKEHYHENTSEEVKFDTTDEFRTNKYYVTIDKPKVELQKIKCAYGRIIKNLGF